MDERNIAEQRTGVQHEQQQHRAGRSWAIDHVVCGGGNCTAQGPCYYEEVCASLKAGGVHAVCVCPDTE